MGKEGWGWVAKYALFLLLEHKSASTEAISLAGSR